MKTVDRYLCVHFLGSLLGVLFIAVVVILIGEMTDIYSDIVSHSPEGRWVLAYLALILPEKLAEVVPLATAVAVLWTLLRLARQNELLAFFCGGLSPGRVSLPFLGIGLGLSLSLFAFNEVVLPQTREASRYAFEVHVKNRGLTYLTRGARLYQKGAGRRFYSMDHFDPVLREMTRPTFVVLDDTDWRPVMRVEADKAWPIGPEKDRTWRFSNAYVWRFSKDSPGTPVEMRHDEFVDLHMERDLATFLAQPHSPANLTFLGLWNRVRALRSGGHRVPDQATELHLKMAFPLAPLVVTLLVCSFAIHPRAGKMFVQFSSGVMLVVVYYAMTLFLRKMGHLGLIPPFFAAWTPNLIFFVLGGIWFAKNSGIAHYFQKSGEVY